MGFLRNTRHTRTAATLRSTEGHTQVQRRSVTLASATIVGRTQIRRAVANRDWQTEAWDHFDTVGELRFAVRWLANAVSRCALYIGAYTPGSSDAEPVPVDDTDTNALARALLGDLHYGQIGQAEMLRRMATHLSVPGETFLVGLDAAPDTTTVGRRWYVASTDEITVSSRGNSTLVLPDTGETVKLDPDSSTIIRLWNPHPRRGSEPDSAIRATLPPLREVKGLSDHIAATIDSRLAGAGILKIPHSATTPTPQQSDPGATQPLHGDAFTDALMKAMLTPIADRDDASAVVPIVVKVPDEATSGIEHITLSSELSDKVTQMRDKALERFATGADLPAEVVTGAASMNHWGAWQIEESSIKLHVEPLIAVICDALTQQYLWPALAAAGEADPTQWVIWYDSSELSQRPNKATEAQTLYDKGVISAEALLRENGFSSQDAPTAAEHAQWMAERIAIANPELIGSLRDLLTRGGAAAVADTLPAAPPDTDPAAAPTPAGPPGATTATAHRPRTDADGDAAHQWWLRAVEQVVLRALELAGKRILGSLPRAERSWDSAARNVDPWDIHTVAPPTASGSVTKLMDNALETAAPNFTEAPCVLETVEAYVAHLLATGNAHSRTALRDWLADSGCQPPDQE